MSFRDSKVARYFRRMGAGSLVISVVVHAVLIILAITYAITVVREERKVAFRGDGTHNGGPRSPEHRVTMARQQTSLAMATKRLSVDSPSANVSLPDLPDMPSISGGSMGMTSSFSGGGTGGGGPPGAGAGTSMKAPPMPFLGSRQPQAGGALKGHLYDLKQNSSGKPNPDLASLGPANLAAREVTAFIRAEWATSTLSKFYKAPATLYATQIFVPLIPAEEAPKAYGVEKEVQPSAWIAYYRGRVSPPATGVYRFVGAGDDLMAIRLDGRLVLDCGGVKGSDFNSDRKGGAKANYNYKFDKNNWLNSTRGGFTVGNRMELRAGQFYDIDIVFSEGPGRLFCAMLLVEQEGVTYKKDANGNPILPIFRLSANKTPPVSTGPEFDPEGPVWRAVPQP